MEIYSFIITNYLFPCVFESFITCFRSKKTKLRVSDLLAQIKNSSNSFFFPFRNIHILSSFLKDRFTVYKILGWLFLLHSWIHHRTVFWSSLFLNMVLSSLVIFFPLSYCTFDSIIFILFF